MKCFNYHVTRGDLSSFPGLLAFHLFYQGSLSLEEQRLESGWIRARIWLGPSASAGSSQYRPLSNTSKDCFRCTKDLLICTFPAAAWFFTPWIVAGLPSLLLDGNPEQIRIILALLDYNKCFRLEADLAHNSRTR
jgi:hypothetical protein